MLADSGADSGRDFRGGNVNQVVPNPLALSGGDGDAGERHKKPVGADYLKKLGFMDVHRIDSVVIDDGP